MEVNTRYNCNARAGRTRRIVTRVALPPLLGCRALRREMATAAGGPSVGEFANPNYKPPPPRTGAWASAAYDPEAPGPLYSAEQIRVPPELAGVVKEYTKAAIRAQPSDLICWSKRWFEQRCAERDGAAPARS